MFYIEFEIWLDLYPELFEPCDEIAEFEFWLPRDAKFVELEAGLLLAILWKP